HRRHRARHRRRPRRAGRLCLAHGPRGASAGGDVMAAILFRVLLVALGLGAAEIGLTGVVTDGSAAAWALLLFVGMPLIVAGSAGIIGPFLGTPVPAGRSVVPSRPRRIDRGDRSPGDRPTASS